MKAEYWNLNASCSTLNPQNEKTGEQRYAWAIVSTHL